MQYYWINKAMENGGVMTITRRRRKVKATMYWKHGKKVRGPESHTIPDALAALDQALGDDAADEMIEGGGV